MSQSAPDQVARIFGPTVGGRTCGACSACCTHLGIDTPEFTKPQGMPCQHLGSRGCSIYERRPTTCRTWHCLWRHIPNLPVAARPDLCGAILSIREDDAPKHPLRRIWIQMTVLDPDRAALGLIDGILGLLSQGDLPVWISRPGQGTALAYPTPEVCRAAMGDRTAPAAAQTEGWRWRSGIRTEG